MSFTKIRGYDNRRGGPLWPPSVEAARTYRIPELSVKLIGPA